MLSKILNFITPTAKTTTIIKENTTMTTTTPTLQDLNFNDKESYFAWRKEWFEAYKAAISAVRAGKQTFKEEQRKVTIVEKQYPWGKEHVPMYGDKPLDWRCEDYYKWFKTKNTLIREIEKLVSLRQSARVKSAEQREAMLKERGLI